MKDRTNEAYFGVIYLEVLAGMLGMDELFKEQVKKKNKGPETGIAENIYTFWQTNKQINKI